MLLIQPQHTTKIFHSFIQPACFISQS